MVSRTLLETAKTAKSTKKLPILAAITILHLETKYVAKTPPNNPEPSITKATPKLAPELRPSTNGPAKGFLNKVCINNPETPSPEPTSIAVMAFGSLKSLTMTIDVLFSLTPKRQAKISLKAMLIDPKLIFSKKHNRTIKASIINCLLYVVSFFN